MDWKLAKDKDGIQVYTRSVLDYGLKEYKVTMTVTATKDEVRSMISSVDQYVDWMFQISHAEIVSNSENELVTYVIQNTPWPAKNRDICTRLVFIDLPSGALQVDIHCTPDEIDLKDKCIRVPKIKGHWLVESLDDGQVKITQQVAADPGGNIPDWMANAVVTENPYKTFRNMKQVLL